LADEVKGITPKQVDLSDSDDLETFCEYISALKDRVTILINNAGYSIRGALEDVPLDAARRMFDVNVFAMMRVTQACLPAMRAQRKGTIVNLSSIVGKFTFPMSGPYAATKHAVEAISDSLRMEVRPFGIRVIIIRPGPVASEFNEVATQLTGDLFARTAEDYKPVYQASGAAVGKLFTNLTVPGPEVVADTIVSAVLSEKPKPVYAMGPFTEDLLGQRFKMDDEGYDKYLSDKMGLWGFTV
jgi:short-subunit dehydrogenase